MKNSFEKRFVTSHLFQMMNEILAFRSNVLQIKMYHLESIVTHLPHPEEAYEVPHSN